MAAMDLYLTLIILAISLAVAVVSGWRGALPPNIKKGPRMMPWRFLMLASAALCFLLLIHLATLFSGRTFPSV